MANVSEHVHKADEITPSNADPKPAAADPQSGGEVVADTPAASGPDPFDPERFRLDQDFAEIAGVKKALTVVPCRKPKRHEFVRVRPGAAWSFDTAVYEDPESREDYLVDPVLHPLLGNDVDPVCLRLAINRNSDVFLWRLKLSRANGQSNPWNDSAKAAAQLAESDWLRVSSNLSAGCYDTNVATADIEDPTWPEESLGEILGKCFSGRVIDDINHPLLRALRGEL